MPLAAGFGDGCGVPRLNRCRSSRARGVSSSCRDALRHWFGFMACCAGLLLPFVFAQRWHFHLGLARIRPRHGLAVMAQIHLRIPFGIARRFRPFGPSVVDFNMCMLILGV